MNDIAGALRDKGVKQVLNEKVKMLYTVIFFTNNQSSLFIVLYPTSSVL